MKMMKTIGACLIAAVVVVDIGAGAFFFDAAVRRHAEVPRGAIPPDSDDFVRNKFKYEQAAQSWVASQPFQDVEITSADGLKLHGYYLSASQSSPNTAILVHGYRRDGKTDMAKFARFYHDKLDDNVLVVDDRAHGKSEGQYIGFGWLDRRDVRSWIDYVNSRSGSNTKIVLHGLSMGAAAVLIASGETLPPNVRAIVADSAYTDAAIELKGQLAAQYGLPSFPILPTTSMMTWLRAGYFFGEASPLAAVRKSATPILFIHGGDDDFVPTPMVYELYDNCASDKEMLIVPHARHTDALMVAPVLYETTVSTFLAKHLGDTISAN